MTDFDDLIPISSLFFDDAGPHIVRAGTSPTPTGEKFSPARGQELRSLLNTSIAQLGAVSGETRRRTPTPVPPPVPIESLLYSGRSALNRALEVRESIISSADPPDDEDVREILDLIALAARD